MDRGVVLELTMATKIASFRHDPNEPEDADTIRPPKAALARMLKERAAHPHLELRHDSNTMEWSLWDGPEAGR